MLDEPFDKGESFYIELHHLWWNDIKDPERYEELRKLLDATSRELALVIAELKKEQK